MGFGLEQGWEHTWYICVQHGVCPEEKEGGCQQPFPVCPILSVLSCPVLSVQPSRFSSGPACREPGPPSGPIFPRPNSPICQPAPQNQLGKDLAGSPGLTPPPHVMTNGLGESWRQISQTGGPDSSSGDFKSFPSPYQSWQAEGSPGGSPSPLLPT